MLRRVLNALALSALALTLTACGLLALPVQLASIPLNAIAPKNIYVVNETSDPTVQGAILTESVVRIICTDSGETGTGFLHKSSLILTAAHVVANCNVDNIKIQFSDGTETRVVRKTWNTSEDLAALYPKVSLDGRRVILLSALNSVTIGEQVTIWGFPKGTHGTTPILSTGYIAGVERNPIYRDKSGPKPMGTNLLIINGDINPGNSGSPVLRISDGSIIGVVVRKSGYSAGVGYAVPTDAVGRFLRREQIEP